MLNFSFSLSERRLTGKGAALQPKQRDWIARAGDPVAPECLSPWSKKADRAIPVGYSG